MLKIAAISCQWLNVDVIGQGEKLFFSEKSREKYKFSQRSQGKFIVFG